ncbi:MAG: DUF808 domain-containing protein [Methylobacter sp.]
MAGTSLLALLDDIASVLDDVALMTKMAAKKTAGVLGDDLALNAEQVSGIRAERELPVVWAVAKGSLKNKLILVPSALAISWGAPWLITPLLMLGGTYLCLEGFEKVAHPHENDKADLAAAVANPEIDLVAFELDKIKGAVRTDFVLSAEIIVITLGSVATSSFAVKAVVLSIIALVMTAGVYGVVAAIVKMDDAGLHLCQKTGDGLAIKMLHSLGQILLNAAPYLMKLLTIVGTAAMFMVGGGILVHGIPAAHHLVEQLAHNGNAVPVVGGLLEVLTSAVLNVFAGMVIGAFALGGMETAKRVYGRLKWMGN